MVAGEEKVRLKAGISFHTVPEIFLTSPEGAELPEMLMNWH